MNNWISVKDRLPESGRYLLYIKDEEGGSWIQCGGYSKYSDKHYWFAEDENTDEVGLDFNEKVIFWQPLPEPPKD